MEVSCSRCLEILEVAHNFLQNKEQIYIYEYDDCENALGVAAG